MNLGVLGRNPVPGMLLTRNFTFIHFPKTGGTFVTAILERLHGVPRGRAGLAIRRFANKVGVPIGRQRRRYGELRNVAPHHGTCRDIPAAHAEKPILSCIRSPHDWYVSQYEFGWWSRTSDYHSSPESTPAGAAIEAALPEFVTSHPHFPAIDFAEFMQLCEAAAGVYNRSAGASFGLFTHSFVRFFYRDPQSVLRKLDESYVTSGQHLADRFDVAFLRTESLNCDLVAALGSFGYSDEDLEIVRRAEKVLPMGRGRTQDQKWENYYTDELAASVRARDWPLFTMFPEYGPGGT